MLRRDRDAVYPFSGRRGIAEPALPRLPSFQARVATPFAVLGIRTAGNLLTDIEYLPRGAATLAPLNRVAEEACRQIGRYLDDPEFAFDVPLQINGTAFRRRVWQAICKIPGGRTLTYGEIARSIGSAPRAVGGACGANRIPLVIPCHRVVAAGGIGGFMHARGGAPIAIKQWLLAHEHAG